MQYYVLSPTGERFGPADVYLLNQWTREGRIDGTFMVEEVSSGRVVSISSVEGYHTPPPVNAYYPRGAGPTISYQYVPNNLVKAILSTLFCCLPVGIVAIVYAAQVDGHSRRGDIVAAQNSAKKADIWANWSIGLVLAYFLIVLLFTLFSGGFNSSSPLR